MCTWLVQRLLPLLPAGLHVVDLGRQTGQASLMKMLIGGLSKGLCTLFLELVTAAQQAGVAREFLTQTREFYPGVYAVAERLAPTVARHAARRADEMAELAATLGALGLSPELILAVRSRLIHLHQTGRPFDLAQQNPTASPRPNPHPLLGDQPEGCRPNACTT